jgi:Conserved TM helix
MRITTALGEAFGRVVSFVPNLIAALVILAVGFFVAVLLERVTRRVLTAVGLNRRPLAHRLLGESQSLNRLPSIGGRIVYWVSALVTCGVAIDALHLGWLSAGVSRVLGYIPSVLAASAIVVAGYVGANFAHRQLASRGAGSALWARLARGAILTVAGFMALQQLGIATAIVTTAFTVALSAMAVAGALAFGLGNRELAGRVTRDWYERRSIQRYRHFGASDHNGHSAQDSNDELPYDSRH